MATGRGESLPAIRAVQGPAFISRETMMEPQTGRGSRRKQGEAASPKSSRGKANRPLDQTDIARRAYALFQQRGGADGHDWEDWLAAERQLEEERARSRRSQ